MALPKQLVESLRAVDGVRVWADAPLAPFTTIGTGGKAGLLVTCTDTPAVVATLALLEDGAEQWICLGAGSNFLVADDVYPGGVVKLGREFQYVEGLVCPASSSEPVVVTVGAAASLPRVAAAAAEVGLAGLDFACGIPGTIGGAVAMNAGAYGHSFVEVLEEVELAAASGAAWVPAPSLDCGYRHCNLPRGSIVTAARLRLTAGAAAEVLECHRETLRKRRVAQPQGVRTFGSTFMNPSGEGAGRLIDAAGLKGVRRGGAEISNVHANFLVNLGDATTADVLALMDLMRGEVKRTCGVELEPEVRLIGSCFPWESSVADSQEPPDSHG